MTSITVDNGNQEFNLFANTQRCHIHAFNSATRWLAAADQASKLVYDHLHLLACVLENVAHAPNTPKSSALENEVLDLLAVMNHGNYVGGTRGVVDAIESSQSRFLVRI
jgi:hypothetical protein